MMDDIFDQNEIPSKDFDALEAINSNMHVIFPDTKELAMILSDAKPEDEKVVNIFAKKFLPFHIRDNQWVANYLRTAVLHFFSEENSKKIKLGQKPDDITKIEFPDLEKFVAKSYKFNRKRNAFEGMIVREVTKNQTLNTNNYNPVAVRESVLDTLEKKFGIDSFNGGVEMERNNAWRMILYHKKYNQYLQDTFGATLLNEKQIMLMCENNQELFVDYRCAKTDALDTYENYGERCYFNNCNNARYCAYEAGLIVNEFPINEKLNMEHKIEVLTKKLIKELKNCEKWLDANKGLGQENN